MKCEIGQGARGHQMYLNAVRLLDMVNDGGTLLLLDDVADGLVHSGALLTIDRLTDLFRNDSDVRPALLVVVNCALLWKVRKGSSYGWVFSLA